MLEKALDSRIIERLPSGAIKTLNTLLPELDERSRGTFLRIITDFVKNYHGQGIISHHDFGNYMCSQSLKTRDSVSKKLNELGSSVYCHGL